MSSQEFQRTPASPLEALFDAAGDIAFHLDGGARVTHSCGLHRVAGLEPYAPDGASFFDLFAPDGQARVREHFARAVGSNAGPQQRVRVAEALRPELPTPVRWLLSGYDARGRRGAMAVGHLARPDAPGEGPASSAIADDLTGLPNRLLLQNRCAHAIDIARRQGSGLALLLLNIKGFRKVNDAFGVRTGDELLRKLAQRVQDHLRSSDTVARMGADEFALLLPDMADPENMQKLGQKLLALVEAPFLLDGHDVHVSASMGFALYPLHGKVHEELLLGATAAMKFAKDHGGSACAMYDSGKRADSRAEISMETALHLGVNNGELFLEYQPLVDITGTIYGAEALMRWQRGAQRVPPVEFIPVAEECGLIHVLGSWALKSAASGIARLNHDRNLALTISVNVSPRQFRGATFLRSVTDALAFSGLPPALLQLEITEGTLMADPDAAVTLLARLTALGVKVAVDDFGTGYSSLAYLKRFSLTALKIDRSFIKDLPSKTDLAICRSVFSLSRDLGLKSVAEGVETKEQWHILRDAGCDAIQGYFFGRPQPLAAFAALVAAAPAAPAEGPSDTPMTPSVRRP